MVDLFRQWPADRTSNHTPNPPVTTGDFRRRSQSSVSSVSYRSQSGLGQYEWLMCPLSGEDAESFYCRQLPVGADLLQQVSLSGRCWEDGWPPNLGPGGGVLSMWMLITHMLVVCSHFWMIGKQNPPFQQPGWKLEAGGTWHDAQSVFSPEPQRTNNENSPNEPWGAAVLLKSRRQWRERHSSSEVLLETSSEVVLKGEHLESIISCDLVSGDDGGRIKLIFFQ